MRRSQQHLNRRGAEVHLSRRPTHQRRGTTPPVEGAAAVDALSDYQCPGDSAGWSGSASRSRHHCPRRFTRCTASTAKTRFGGVAPVSILVAHGAVDHVRDGFVSVVLQIPSLGMALAFTLIVLCRTALRRLPRCFQLRKS